MVFMNMFDFVRRFVTLLGLFGMKKIIFNRNALIYII